MNTEELSKLRIKTGSLRTIIVLVLLASAFLLLQYSRRAGNLWYEGLFMNLSTEFIGAVVIYIMFELVIRRSEKREDDLEKLREDLIVQLGSRSNDVALRAVEQLRKYCWLQDGSLHRVSLNDANLQGAGLAGADLESVLLNNANLESSSLAKANLKKAEMKSINLKDANLWNANLEESSLDEADLRSSNLVKSVMQSAKLERCNLQGANLCMAELQNANLHECNLQLANLSMANLQNANLRRANLRATNLSDSNLAGVCLTDAVFDEDTILPNRTKWNPNTDLGCFTEQDHPSFWHSDILSLM